MKDIKMQNNLKKILLPSLFLMGSAAGIITDTSFGNASSNTLKDNKILEQDMKIEFERLSLQLKDYYKKFEKKLGLLKKSYDFMTPTIITEHKKSRGNFDLLSYYEGIITRIDTYQILDKKWPDKEMISNKKEIIRDMRIENTSLNKQIGYIDDDISIINQILFKQSPSQPKLASVPSEAPSQSKLASVPSEAPSQSKLASVPSEAPSQPKLASVPAAYIDTSINSMLLMLSIKYSSKESAPFPPADQSEKLQDSVSHIASTDDEHGYNELKMVIQEFASAQGLSSPELINSLASLMYYLVKNNLLYLLKKNRP